MPSVDGYPAGRLALAGDDAAAKALYTVTNRPPKVELYDLDKDPSELHNLGGDPALAGVRDRLLAQLNTWREETKDPTLTAEGLKALTGFHDTHRANVQKKVAEEKKRLGTKKLPRKVMHRCMQLKPDYFVPRPG